MDRRRTRKIRQSCLEVSLLMIRLLRHENTILRENSKNWHQDFVQNLRLLRIGQFEHVQVSCKEKVVLRGDSNIAWTPGHLTLFCTFDHFNTILKENTLILRCNTTCFYRTTSPSTSITLHAPMTHTPSSSLD